MEERQLRMVVVLAAVLAAIVAAMIWWEPAEDDPLTDEDATELVWQVDAERVSHLEIHSGDEVLALEQRDGEWVMLQPVEAAADQGRVGYLVEDLARIEKGVPIPDADPVEFGLGGIPSHRVVLRADDGTEWILDIGDESPVESMHYVRSADGGVAAVGGMLGYALERPADYYRERRLLDFPRARVSSIRIEGPEGTLQLDRDEHGWWLEGFTRADYDAVDELMMSLLDMRFERFVEGWDDEITDPRFRVVVTGSDGETWGLRVGDETPAGVLVEVVGGPAGWMRPEPLTFLGQGPVDVGDPQAFPVDDASLVRVEVDLGGRSWRLDRDGDQWTRDGQPEPRAEDALALLGEVPIRYRRDPVPPLEESWGTVVLTPAGASPRVIEVGQQLDDRRVARDQRGGEPYLVPAAELEEVAALFTGAGD